MTRRNQIYLHLTLWTLQGWLAMFFLAAGYAKLTEQMDILIVLLSWPAHVDLADVRIVGGVEVLLSVLIVSPLVSWSFGRPLLVLSATAMLMLEAAALVVHASMFEWGHVLTNMVLLLMTVVVLRLRARPPNRRKGPRLDAGAD